MVMLETLLGRLFTLLRGKICVIHFALLDLHIVIVKDDMWCVAAACC